MFRTLFVDSLRAITRPKGLAILLLAALVPPALTAAWALTHQSDVTVTEVTYEPLHPTLLAPENGTARDLPVNITATVRNHAGERVGAFSVTLEVGYFEERNGDVTFRERKSETFRAGPLAPGATQSFTMRNWTAEPGTFIFRARADVDDELQEEEELNNERYEQVVIRVPSFERQALNVPEGGSEGSGTADLTVTALRLDPGEVFQNDEATVNVTVRNDGPGAVVNATVRLQVFRATVLGFTSNPSPNLSERVTLAAGNETTVSFTWRPTAVGQYAVVASAETGASARDPDTSGNSRAELPFVDRRFVYEPPEEKATAKDYYRGTLGILHLKVLIPLVALFYAGGVLEDERSRGNLPYLLTRPLPRWMLPLARLAATLLVAGAAVALGVVLTYLLLLGLPQAPSGYLYWPLLLSLLTLAVYGCLFAFVGVATQRPYLVGLLYVLGLEAVILLGRSILVNGRPLVQDWIAALSVSYWTGKALDGWRPNEGFRWWPEGDAAGDALLVLVGIAVAATAATAWWMRNREVEA